MLRLTQEDDVNTISVVIIRRTAENIIFIHDASGAIISQITPPSGVSQTAVNQAQTSTTYGGSIVFDTSVDSTSINASGRTDGVLAIKNFGGAPSSPQDKFQGHIARFGVIKRDIGTEAAASLAQDLHSLYKPIS